MERAWPLIGRESELDAIGRAVRESGVLLAGPAGVGKTRLAREAVSLAGGRGLRHVWAQGSSAARAVPLGAFAGVVDLPAGEPTRIVPDALAALLAGGPLLLVVDDAHLLDELSALVLHRLVTRRLAPAVVTVRDGEAVPDAVTALWKDDHLTRLDVGPLAEDTTAHLVAQVLGGPVASAATHRLWALTGGAPLFLRHLIRGEVGSGRLSPATGLWSWHDEPEISPELATIVGEQIGELGGDVRDVVDLVSLGEPLAVPALVDLTSSAAVEAAEGQGLVRLGHEHAGWTARLAHPMYGEVRRAAMGVQRARRLRGMLATRVEGDLLQRAVLALDSDLPPDPDLFLGAVAAALEFYDVGLAERLAAAAATTGSFEARLLHAGTLSWLSRGEEAEAALASLLPAAATEIDRERVAAYRAGNLLWTLGRPGQALTALGQGADPAAAPGPGRALRIAITTSTGSLRAGLEEAPALLHAGGPADGLTVLVLASAQAAAAAVSGRLELLDEAAEAAALNPRGTAAGIPGFGLGDWRILGHRLAGQLDRAADVADEMHAASADLPGPPRWMGLVLAGHAALASGRVRDACRLLVEAWAGLAPTTHEFRFRCRTLLATAYVLAGDTASAQPLLRELEGAPHPAYLLYAPDDQLARAWAAAGQGAVSVAREHARSAAALARAQESPAYEVHAWQVAAQLGDPEPARLAELAEQVDGPRVHHALAHARALASGDGDALDTAATGWAELGDLVAAADAAAQAAEAHRSAGRRGSALASAGRATTWAGLTHAHTPALESARTPLPLTGREREIVTLAARGLSNREIAERLVVSVRTVEGHLYRAGHKLGVSERGDLRRILPGADE